MLPFEPLKTQLNPVFTGEKPKEPIASTSAYGVLKNQGFPPAYKAPPTPANQKTDVLPPKSSVRTYKSDVESMIQADHLSSVNIALAEQQRQRQIEKVVGDEDTNPNPETPSTKNKLIILISTIFVLIGLASLAIIFYIKKPATEVQNTIQIPDALFTVEYRDEINITTLSPNALLTTLGTKLNENNTPFNKFYSPYLTLGTSTGKRLATAIDFVNRANLQLPDMLKRALLPNFMIGSFSGTELFPFVILKISNSENAYAGMLQWEENLRRDFQTIFRIENYLAKPLEEILSTTNNYRFDDAVLMNKDLRRLRNTTDKTLLLYSLIDKNTVVITTNESAFREIYTRLNNERGLQR